MQKFDIIAILLIILAAIILLYRIDKPFWGQFDWTGAWFGTIARNYLQIDIAKTRLAPITVAGTVNKVDWKYYNHYPITLPIIIAASLAVFGVHEWSIRLVPLVFSLLMLGSFYMLCRRFFHPLVGIFGLASVLVTPMLIYYGKLPVHEQPVLFFSLAALYCYLAKRKRLMLLFFVLAFIVSWTGAYILLLITVYNLAVDRQRWRELLPAYLALAGVVILHFIHIYFSSDLRDFSLATADRTKSGGSPIAFLIKQTKWFLALYTKPLTLISFLSLILWRKPLLLMFFVWGFFQWVVVNSIAWIHDYMLIYFLPFVALSSGLFFWKVWRINRYIFMTVFSAVIVLSLFWHLSFTAALLNSKDQTSEIYPVANFIRDHSSFGDRIFVAVKPGSDFEVHYPSHYLSYYTDRYVKYGTINGINPGYNYVISKGDRLENLKLVRDFGDFHIYEN